MRSTMKKPSLESPKPIKKIVSVNAVTQAVVSILLQRPDDARARPGDYFKDDTKYESVFDNPKIPSPAYLACVQLVKRVENALADRKIENSDEKNIKFYVAALLARELTGMAQPIYAKLPTTAKVEDALINQCYHRIQKMYAELSKKVDKDSVARGPSLLKKMDAQWKRRKSKAGADAKKA
jgi:hypothetical protein